MPKQEFDTLDYLGAVIVSIIFGLILLFISFCCINFCCIAKSDDLTKFEKMGARRNWRVRLGRDPHTIRLLMKRHDDEAEN